MTDYEKALNADKGFQSFRRAVDSGRVKLRDLNKAAEIAGRIAGKTMAEALQTEYPNGQIPVDDVRRIIVPILRQNFKIMTELASEVQSAEYKKAGIGLRATVPEYDANQEAEIAKRISEESYKDEQIG